jgi:hypothetical protein
LADALLFVSDYIIPGTEAVEELKDLEVFNYIASQTLAVVKSKIADKVKQFENIDTQMGFEDQKRFAEAGDAFWQPRFFIRGIDGIDSSLEVSYANRILETILFSAAGTMRPQWQINLAVQYLQKYQEGSASPSVEEKVGAADPLGGIDFGAGLDNTLVIEPMGTFRGLNFLLPQLSKSALQEIDLEVEIQDLKNKVTAGILVSGDHIKEIIAACCSSGAMDKYRNDIMWALVKTCQWQEQEDPLAELPDDIKEAMVILDSVGATG